MDLNQKIRNNIVDFERGQANLKALSKYKKFQIFKNIFCFIWYIVFKATEKATFNLDYQKLVKQYLGLNKLQLIDF